MHVYVHVYLLLIKFVSVRTCTAYVHVYVHVLYARAHARMCKTTQQTYYMLYLVKPVFPVAYNLRM